MAAEADALSAEGEDLLVTDAGAAHLLVLERLAEGAAETAEVRAVAGRAASQAWETALVLGGLPTQAVRD
ncbi:hypothetical protein [Cellulomonas triticagri]|uniref:Uncharacterized protein n=1 Tax=Cellulomonas triticagri TaxID=2483352 RepID=A0A3M2J458_9CELL|nr:hypothetical protein [Cellulomonas triticagri]RMI06871.1 hypothetical protein EBM89_14845 [Cellulomonas triticagri]